MEIICGKPSTLNSFPTIEYPPINRLADGISPTAILSGKKSKTQGAILFADGAYASRDNIQMCKERGIHPVMLTMTKCNA